MSVDSRDPPPSLAGRLLGKVALVERHELPAVLAAFGLFFCVFSGYFSVRPVRETVGTILGEERVQDLWVATAIAAVAIVPLYGAIVARFRRSVFLPWIFIFVASSFALVGTVLGASQKSVGVAQFFYVFYSVLNLFLISVCWSFLLELFDSTQSKRLFGIIAAGGTAGALFGPVVAFFTVRTIGNNGILFMGALLFILAIFFQRILLRIWSARVAAQPGAKDKAMGGNPFAGFTLVLRSPYLLGIALFVVFISTVSTLLYFEQLRLVKIFFSDPAERTRVFAAIDGIVQGLTIISQIFLTGRIASRLGLVVLLTIVPVAMIFGFFALAATGTFMALAVVMVLRRAGEYAFVRPGREILWSRLDNESKYKAKNLIDVPVYRASDALAAQLDKALDAARVGPAAVAILGAVVAAAWAVNGWWLGRQHDRATAQQPAVATQS